MRNAEINPTRDVILKAAEEMFAQRGYRAVSVREITRACDVNTAAIHYHFGSKHALLEEIFVRRCLPMNAERLRLLGECREGPGRPPILEQILEAYLRPSLIWPDDPEGARHFLKLRAILGVEQEGLARDLIARHFDHVSRRFIDALIRALPEISPEEVYWRVHFLHGAQYYTLLNPGRIRDLSSGACNPAESESALRRMVAFFALGFRLRSDSQAPAGDALQEPIGDS
jgi:AcrR family transcriptional regulator